MSPDRPLEGRCVAVTRPREDAGALADRLGALGARVVFVPVFRIHPVDDARFDAALAELANAPGSAMLVFTSRHAVTALRRALDRLDLPAERLAATPRAAVGPATARALDSIGLPPDVVPRRHTAADLVDAVRRAGPRRPERIVYPRSREATGDVERGFEALGIPVESYVAYEPRPEPPVEGRLPEPDAVTFASASAARGFARVAPAALLARARERLPAVCIGPTTAAAARQHGFRRVVTAATHTADGLVDAVVRTLVPTASPNDTNERTPT